MKKQASILLLSWPLIAQNFNCGTGGDADDPNRNSLESIQNKQKVQLKYEERLDCLKSYPNEKSGEKYVITVVFHVMHNYGSWKLVGWF